MSDRTPQRIAAQALREGLDIFWPDKEHWAQRAFFKPIFDGTKRIGSAVCLDQLVTESVQRLVGIPLTQLNDMVFVQSPTALRVSNAAREAILKAAFQIPNLDNLAGHLIALNDSDDATYEQVRGYVEVAARELETA